MEQFTRSISRGEGQSEQANQLGQALRVGEVGVLEVEAPAFQAAEQSLHLPAVGVGVEGLRLWGTGRGDEEELASVQAQRRQADEATPHGPPTRQQVACAGFQPAESRV